MPRVKRGAAHKKRKKKIMDMAKGYQGGRSRSYRVAKEAVQKSLQYAYRDRRTKKRDFRKLWIIRINAAARLNGLSYSNMMNGLKLAEVEINRKMLAEMAVNDPGGFTAVAELAKEGLKKAGELQKAG